MADDKAVKLNIYEYSKNSVAECNKKNQISSDTIKTVEK